MSAVVRRQPDAVIASAAQAGARGSSRTVWSSVAQLPQLVQVGAAELDPHPAGQHLKDQHREQHVGGGTEFDDEREPSGGQECQRGDPVVQHEEADDLRDGAAAADEQEDADEYDRKCDGGGAVVTLLSSASSGRLTA